MKIQDAGSVIRVPLRLPLPHGKRSEATVRLRIAGDKLRVLYGVSILPPPDYVGEGWAEGAMRVTEDTRQAWDRYLRATRVSVAVPEVGALLVADLPAESLIVPVGVGGVAVRGGFEEASEDPIILTPREKGWEVAVMAELHVRKGATLTQPSKGWEVWIHCC